VSSRKSEPSGRPRIAVAFQGDATDPRAWSGVPFGLLSGLSAVGADPVPIDARLPGTNRLANALRMSWAAQAANGPLAAAGGAVATRAIGRAGIDGVVAIGSGFALSVAAPVATMEDMTLAQALRNPDPAIESLGAAAADRWRRRQQRIYERSDSCCVASSWTARSVREDYGITNEKIHIVGIGRNIEEGVRAERDWSVPRFLWVGFDWERKRGAAVVEAFAAVRAERPEATLDLVGRHPSVERHGVRCHGVLSLGSESGRRRYRELLDRATCFLMPSTYEPFGIAYLDAGAVGVASVGTTVGGALDSIGPGGVLVDPNDAEALPAAMLELADPETASRLGQLAFEHSARFTWRAVAERMLRALQPRGVNLDPHREPERAP
jgi:glycogen synthase